jgi:nucleoside-diphosphate-sugar epimerase
MVTGSTGFVGHHLIPKLLQHGHEILEITIEPEVSKSIFGTSTSRFTLSDNQEDLVARVKDYNPQIIIHLASYLTSADDYVTLQKLLKANVEFFCRILDCTKYIDLKLFINTGSFSEYLAGKDDLLPAYLYSATKIAARSMLNYYARIGNFKQTTAVPYTIYGGIDSQKKIIDHIYDSLGNPNATDLSLGEQVLDFIHISDITSYYSFVVDNCENYPEKSEFQLGTGEGVSIRQLARLLEEKTQMTANINWGGRPYRESDIMHSIAHNTELVIQWEPKISLSEGLDIYIAKKN